MRFLLVKFVGKGAPRHDNILHTQRVWETEGAVIRVPADEADKYLQYPMVWKLATPDTVDYEDIERLNSPEQVALLCGFIGMLTKENIATVINEARAALKDAGAEEQTALGYDPTDPEECRKHDERISRIAAVVAEMPRGQQNFLPNGRPKLNRVREACKNIEGITQAEVDQVWVRLKKAA